MLSHYILMVTISFSATVYGMDSDKKTDDVNSKTDKILLGKSLFMDSNLSEPAGQSCVSCHSFGAGLADPDQAEATSRGVDPNRFGSRNTPMSAYAAFTPEFHYDKEEELYVGGQFLDGRASSLEDQAKLPFFNEVEMNNPDEATLVKKIRKSAYADLFKSVYGDKSLDDPKKALDHVGDAIAEFERTDVFAPFSSKFDYVQAGKAQFTKQEMRGFDLFKAEDKGNCAACHPAEVDQAGCRAGCRPKAAGN
jgi:cytochrome c peroxidase